MVRATHNHGGSPTLISVAFIGNRAGKNGGGLANVVDTNLLLVNVLFSGNHAGRGSAIHIFQSDPALTNITVSGSQASMEGAGVFSTEGGLLVIQNSIVWGNSAPALSTRHARVATSLPSDTPRFVRNPSCGADGICTDDPVTAADESADDDYGDLRLQPISPAVDAGNNTADLDESGPGSTTIADISTDLGGNERIIGSKGAVAVVDLGAYEAGTRLNLPLLAETLR